MGLAFRLDLICKNQHHEQFLDAPEGRAIRKRPCLERMSAACPCGRIAAHPAKPAKAAKPQPLPFSACCSPYLNEKLPAPNAEALMRSRYSAFVFQRADYLLATWHASTRPATLDFAPGAKWLGLEVRSHCLFDADHAEVEFVARCREGGRATRLHERSRFVRASGRWFYVDGDQF